MTTSIIFQRAKLVSMIVWERLCRLLKRLATGILTIVGWRSTTRSTVLQPGPCNVGPAASPVGFVSAHPSRRELVAEVVYLRAALEEARRGQIRSMEIAEARVDRLLEKQDKIIDQRLGLSRQEVVRAPGEIVRPIGRRNWKDARNEYEDKRRAEFWAKKIEETGSKNK